MHVQKLTPEPGVMIMKVGPLAVARATKVDRGWRVRALIARHEELVLTESAAEAVAMEDVHEVFPGMRLEMAR